MYKNFTIIAAGMLFACAIALGQEQWNYTGDITFAPADSGWARPYLCTFDASGNLWVMTTSSIDTATHNALFKAAPGSALFTKVYDFTAHDADQFSGKGLSGLGAIGNDIVVFSRVDVNYGHSFYLPNGDPASMSGYGPSGGYGTHMFGSAATRDSFVYSGISAWGISLRIHNFSSDRNSGGYGAWVPFSTTDGSTAPKEPGGPTADGSALIRDVALIPNGNYDDSTTVFYTSRNSEAGIQNGGIAVWKGGTQRVSPVNPEKYHGSRVQDFQSDLQWGLNSPYGITVDTLGRLWACGTDSTRRWVRVYTVDYSSDPAYATMDFELPAKNSPSPNSNGANMLAPADVAVYGSKAYVTDISARKVFVFEKSTTGVTNNLHALPGEYALRQNYPNPFNPATLITYELPKSGRVTLNVFNLLGQQIATLVDGYEEAGTHQAVFNAGARNLSSGLYLYQLHAGSVTITKKMILTK